MNLKIISTIDDLAEGALFVRLPNGYHINEKVISEFYGRLLRLYRFSGSEDSPIASVYAAMIDEENRYSYFVDTNPFDSYRLNEMHGVSFGEKTANISDWEKRFLIKEKVIKKGKIGFLKKEGFNLSYNFYAQRLNWRSFMPIYLLNAEKSRS